MSMDGVRGLKESPLDDGSSGVGGADGKMSMKVGAAEATFGDGTNKGDVRVDSVRGVAEFEGETKLGGDCVGRFREQGGSGVRTCFYAVTEEMASMEVDLQAVLVGFMTGSKMCVTTGDIARAAEADSGVPAASLKIFRTGPSMFLIKCVSADVRDQLIAAERIEGNGFCLDLKRWSREDGSTEINMAVKVQIRIVGLPAHAWNEKYVRSVVEDYCWVEAVHMCGFMEGDMSNVVVDAWTESADNIPPEKDLAIPEPLVGTMLEPSSLVTPPWSIRKLRKYPIYLETEVVAFSPLGGVSPDRFGSDSGDDGCPIEPFCWSSSSPGYESLEDADSDREPYAWKLEGC